jgi:hypothetical protein
MPTFVAYPHVISDGSITPGQHASFLGKMHDPLLFTEDPNSSGFRLPELSLPDGLPIDRLHRRREMQRLVDQQARLLDYSAEARGFDQYYERPSACSPATSAAGVRSVRRIARNPRPLWPHELRPVVPAGPPAGRGGRQVCHRLFQQHDRRPKHRQGGLGHPRL